MSAPSLAAASAVLVRHGRPLVAIERHDIAADPGAGATIVRRALADTDPAVRWAGARRLPEVVGTFAPTGAELLERALTDFERAVRQEATATLALGPARLPAPLVVQVVERVLCDPASIVHQDGTVLLAQMAAVTEPDRLTDDLTAELDSRDAVRRAAIGPRLRALAHHAPHNAVALIVRTLTDDDALVRQVGAEALAVAPYHLVSEQIGWGLRDIDPVVRRSAFGARVAHDVGEAPEATVASVRSALAAPRARVRAVAAWSLGVLALHLPDEAVGLFEQALTDGHHDVRRNAVAGAVSLGRRSPGVVLELLRAVVTGEGPAASGRTSALLTRSLHAVHPALTLGVLGSAWITPGVDDEGRWAWLRDLLAALPGLGELVAEGDAGWERYAPAPAS